MGEDILFGLNIQDFTEKKLYLALFIRCVDKIMFQIQDLQEKRDNKRYVHAR